MKFIKKLTAVFSATAMLFGGILGQFPSMVSIAQDSFDVQSNISVISGDINSDGVVDAFDLALLKRAIKNGTTVNLPIYNADVNLDGVVDMYDCCTLQNFLLNKSMPVRNMSQYEENFSDKEISNEKEATAILFEKQSSLGLSQDGVKLVFDHQDTIDGCDFYHYNMTYHDIPVYDKKIVVSADQNDNPYLIIGNCSEIESVSTVPKISEEEAIKIANENVKADVFSSAELILFKRENKFDLMYKLSTIRFDVFVDAQNGRCEIVDIANSYEIVKLEGQDGEEVDIPISDYIDIHSIHNNDVFFDEKRNIIVTEKVAADGSFTEFQSSDWVTLYKYQTALWEGLTADSKTYKSAVDAMSNAIKVYDYYKPFNIEFSKIYLNVSAMKMGKDNALGSGVKENEKICIFIYFLPASGGKKELSGYLDVVAHEFTHGVTNAIAFGVSGYDINNLEIGALKEAYSDIFGELVELYYNTDKQTDWVLTSRNIRKPSESKNPDKYNGTNFYFPKGNLSTDSKKKESADEYAHHNSTVISHAAYLMYNGYDTMINNEIKRVSLTANELSKVWFTSLQYLNSESTMQDCANAVIASAGLLLNSEKLDVVRHAFRDVNLSDYVPISRGYCSNNAKIKVLDKFNNTYSGDYSVACHAKHKKLTRKIQKIITESKKVLSDSIETERAFC